MNADGAPRDGLTIAGGPGGVGARIEDLEAAASLLNSCAAELSAAAGSVDRLIAGPTFEESFYYNPASFWPTRAALASAACGPQGLASAARQVQALGAHLRATAAGYAAAEASAVAHAHRLDLAVGRFVGRRVGILAGAGGLLAVGSAPQWLGGALVVDRLSGGSLGRAVRSGLGDAASGAAGRLAGGGDLTENAVAALPGLLDGLLDGVLGPLPVLGPSWRRAAGTGWPPHTVPETAALVAALGGAAGLLQETGDVTGLAAPPDVGPAPVGVAGLAGLVASAYPARSAAAGAPAASGGRGAAAGTVRVVRLDGAGRRSWVIAIPGTQVWAPRTGPNPLDVTSAVRSMAGRQNAAAAAVVEAMRTAGVRPGEPVCLVGHSLGGMVAAGLAADPALRQRYRITEVVTLGSPVATYPVLRDVGVLALEHTDDLVPKLDGAINPDRTRWVTVRHQVTPSGVTPDVVVTHDVSTYVRTAALLDTSPDPALIEVRSRLAPFLAAPGRTATVVDVTARRDLR